MSIQTKYKSNEKQNIDNEQKLNEKQNKIIKSKKCKNIIKENIDDEQKLNEKQNKIIKSKKCKNIIKENIEDEQKLNEKQNKIIKSKKSKNIIKENIEDEHELTIFKNINRGNGAGGENTTKNGINFELQTSIENTLLKYKFKKCVINKTNKKNKYNYYFELNNKNKKIIYLTQNAFKLYFKKEFDINIYKNPDEAFLIFTNNECNIKILEKKNQNVSGSVEDKLKTGRFNRREYEKIFEKETENKNILYKFNIFYAFCISKFLENKFESNEIKYNTIKEIMKEDNINLFYGEHSLYFDNILKWIYE
jgi:hypothetical protein